MSCGLASDCVLQSHLDGENESIIHLRVTIVAYRMLTETSYLNGEHECIIHLRMTIVAHVNADSIND